MNNLKNDLARGEGNRLAPGATLRGEGNSPADHKHVSRRAPFLKKRKEVKDGLQYQADAINRDREADTSAKRRNKDVKAI